MARGTIRSRVAVVAAALVAAALYAIGFPPLAFAPAAWVALCPWLLVIRRATIGRVVARTMLFTVVATYATVGWTPRVVAEYYGRSALSGWLFFAGVVIFIVAPQMVAFALAYRTLVRRLGALLPLVAAAAWVAAELGRDRLTPDPFLLLGYSQAFAPRFIQIADLLGVYGVSFVVVAVNVALVEVGVALGTARRLTRPAVAGAALAGLLVALTIVYGGVRLRAETAAASDRSVTRVALVQGNLDLGAQWRSEFYGRNLETYLRLTAQAAEGDAPSLVVWPENAMTFFLETEPLYQLAVGRVLKHVGAELVAGGPHRTPGGLYHNSAFLVSEDGRVLGRYDKRRLLPFAEYFPLTGVEVLRRNFGRVREFSRGAPGPPLPTAAGPAGVLICNEAMFPEIASERVAEGAAYLINLSNDSWINDRRYGETALGMSVFRAVEQRRYLLRASTSGPSAIVEPSGRIVARGGESIAAVISGGFAPRDGRTPYSRIGDVFAVGCALLVVAVLISGAAWAKRRKPSTPEAET
jgi:apolipoprotein N-acyltransferase